MLKGFKLNKTAGCGSPCHGDRTSRDLNSSSHTGGLDGPQDVPEGNGTPLSPSWRYAFHTACRCTEPFKLTHLKDLAGSAS